MALHKKTEFAEKCGISRSDLNTYINRKKVVVENDMIDDSNLVNADFLKKRLDKVKMKLEKESLLISEIEGAETVTDKKDVKKTPPADKSDKLNPNESLYALDKIKKALDIDKITEEIEILKVKKDKLHGVVIPTELVKMVFTQHSKSILSSFHNAADTFLTQIAKKKALNINEVAELRGELIEIINTAVNDSIIESRTQIKNIVNEYSERKGVGEREV